MRTGSWLIAAVIVLWGCNSMAASQLPAEIADCKVYKIWQFDSDAGGWVADHNVSPFKITNGILSFENTGPDPWIINRDIGAPDARSFRYLGIKMRSSKDGHNQIYFSTDKHPVMSEQSVVQCPVVASDDFRFYEIDMSRVSTWDGRVEILRLDPANGSDEVGARIEIDWIALYQVPARITIGRPYAGVNGEGVYAVIPIRNVGGEPPESSITVRVAGKETKVEQVQPRETLPVSMQLGSFGKEIPFKVIYNNRILAMGTLASPLEPGSDQLARFGKATTLVFNRVGTKVASAAVLTSGVSGDPETRRAGTLRPLATVAYLDSKGILHYEEISPETIRVGKESAVLQCRRGVENGHFRVSWNFRSTDARDRHVTVTCELVSSLPIKLLRFEGPRLLAGDRSFGAGKTGALFPGLEYLERNEPSSAEKHVGPKFAERRIPHPYKVTLPLMAVESSGLLVGLCWEPLGEWAAGKKLPCAEFESPNLADGARNHLMTLFVPSIPDYVEENSEFAKNPFELQPDQKIKLEMELFALPEARITDAISEYYARKGLIKPPPVPLGLEGTIDLCFKAYTESLYSPVDNGWKNHFGLHQSYSYNNAYAARILAESIRKGDPGLARKCNIDPQAQLWHYTGSTLDWFSPDIAARVESLIKKQSLDGGFPYEISEREMERVKELARIGGSKETTLGEVGRTNSGLTARHLVGLLEHALKTGNKAWVTAAIKGLGCMNRFTVPRGAQTWEVHAHAPDVYAAALCVDANIKGYYLTGDPKYLDYARFWAYTGLPFVYSWVPPIDPKPRSVFHADEKGEGTRYVNSDPAEFYENPERHINPGATIPVFGTTFYVTSWFGNVVQWCGIAWAEAVQRLLKLKSDELLKTVADAVFASCAQQQFDKGWAMGTYPDSWNLLTNTACAPFITPDLIYQYAYGLIGEKDPSRVDYAGFTLRGERAVLSTFALIESVSADNDSLSARLKFYPGQDVWVCLVPVPRPTHVEYDGVTLAESPDIRNSSAAFHYDTSFRALHVKYRASSRLSQLTVQW